MNVGPGSCYKGQPGQVGLLGCGPHASPEAGAHWTAQSGAQCVPGKAVPSENRWSGYQPARHPLSHRPGHRPSQVRGSITLPRWRSRAPREGWIRAQAGSPGPQVRHKSPGSFIKARGCHFHKLKHPSPPLFTGNSVSVDIVRTLPVLNTLAATL